MADENTQLCQSCQKNPINPHNYFHKDWCDDCEAEMFREWSEQADRTTNRSAL